MSDAIERVNHRVSGYMDEILSMFKPGGKITVIVRREGEPTQDFMLTNDTPDEVIALVCRRRDAIAGILTTPPVGAKTGLPGNARALGDESVGG